MKQHVALHVQIFIPSRVLYFPHICICTKWGDKFGTLKQNSTIMEILKRILKRLRIDSLLIPIIDFLLIYFACQIGIRYRNISYEIIRSDLRGFPDDYAWILWIGPFLGVFIFSISNQYKSLFGLFTTKSIYKLFWYSLFLVITLAIIGQIFLFKIPDFKAWIVLYFISVFGVISSSSHY